MKKKSGKILVVDDNAGIRSALSFLLPLHFQEVELIPSPVELMSKMVSFRPDVILLDMNFKRDISTGNEGLHWLSEIKAKSGDTQVVLFTAYADIALAVEGMKRGAFDFIVKPWENDNLVRILSEAYERHAFLKGKAKAYIPEPEGQIYWGKSSTMLPVRQMTAKIAPTDASVLITGENGTGKDLLAKEIHRLSGRRDKNMICVDAGAIPESLFESELFGHIKGAFTDAKSDHTGKIEQANGGTLFLDEIGNIPGHLQSKLLRALQNREITKVGDTKTIPVNIRLICATNRDLPGMIRNGLFREDLYYRINTVHIHLPALRERKEDIIPLSAIFMKEFALKYRRNVSEIDGSAAKVLLSMQWNGNIRELRNCIEKAVILSDGSSLSASDIGTDEQLYDNVPYRMPADAMESHSEEETLEMMEERAIRMAVRKYDGNISHVAKELGISRPTLYSKLKKYNI